VSGTDALPRCLPLDDFEDARPAVAPALPVADEAAQDGFGLAGEFELRLALSDIEKRLVVFVVLTGTVTIAFLTDWLLECCHLRARDWALAAGAVVVAAAAAQITVTDSLDRADARIALEDRSERLTRTDTELRAAEEARRRDARSRGLGPLS
jgi:hypothetical protein